jgi:hypothetical protein
MRTFFAAFTFHRTIIAWKASKILQFITELLVDEHEFFCVNPGIGQNPSRKFAFVASERTEEFGIDA